MEKINPESVGISSPRLRRLSDWLHRQVSSERLAGASVLVSRRGKVAYFDAVGQAELESSKPFSKDTIVRIYSMTKPVTTVAAMMLYEQGSFQLDDPVCHYIPAFAHTTVWRGGDNAIEATEPVNSPMTVRQLMTHTSGLTYSFMRANVIDCAYRKQQIVVPSEIQTLEEWVNRLATIPLMCQPGSEWNYSVSTDVLGRLVEIWSGQSLLEFFDEKIFKPLAMNDTGFHVRGGNHQRFAAMYAPPSGADMSNVGRSSAANEQREAGLLLQESGSLSSYLEPTTLYSGGGGLTSTIEDYARFCQMLLNGGELNGERLLSRKTVEFMRLNQLPGNRDMAAMGQPMWSETNYEGIGFGLGFAVVIDPVKAHIITSVGEHHWGGAASTFFWLDPLEDLFVIFFAQLVPSSTYPIRRELRAIVYQTLID
jgi:CubicO group peptidase (beta-lactamase class C family)